MHWEFFFNFGIDGQDTKTSSFIVHRFFAKIPSTSNDYKIGLYILSTGVQLVFFYKLALINLLPSIFLQIVLASIYPKEHDKMLLYVLKGLL